ncbi:TAXI family TRAP transporter solute-binding subunit [Mesobacterium pallidum]|uniref:TAXI family TRAP transporter solute-binding subunit n=1 Tax=Mesobacterium pallidum TaxID=2872037 RepID=UPI001EE33257|nr:TAXI family TRAP transporter solute-binding subunit [Mesobacterium pallidum]
MKRMFALAASAMIALASPALALDRMTVGTGPAGSLYNQVGTTISTLVQDKLGIPGAARPFTGTTSYLAMVQSGDIEAGILGGLESRDAYAGNAPYPQAMGNLRALLVVTRPSFQFFTRAEDGMTSVADLAGKKVVTKFRAIQAFDEVIAATLASGGLSFDDVEGVTTAGIADAITGVQEGRIDASMVALGIPPLRQADAALPGGIRVLTIGDKPEAITAVLGLSPVEIAPSPAQVGIDAPITAVSFNTFFNVGAGMSDDDAYTLTKTIHENWAEAQEALPPLRGMNPDWMVPETLSLPFHPGAIRYFTEAGMWTEAHQAQQDAFVN